MHPTVRRAFRDHAIRVGLSDYYVSKFTRLASTHNRLMEAECNGDWPCDNGERKVVECSRCGAGYVPSKMFRDRTAPKTGPWIPLICEGCRVEERIKALAAEAGVNVEIQGDPRGWTVKLRRA